MAIDGQQEKLCLQFTATKNNEENKHFPVSSHLFNSKEVILDARAAMAMTSDKHTEEHGTVEMVDSVQSRSIQIVIEYRKCTNENP